MSSWGIGMQSALRLRAVSSEVCKLAGSWIWTSSSGKKYTLKVILADIETEYGKKLWCIKNDAGNILAMVNGYLLCEWLELDMLMTLSPSISLQAASIALVSSGLDEFLIPNRRGQILIEENTHIETHGDFVNIAISSEHDEAQLYALKKCLTLGLSSQLLIQHVHLKDIQKLPIKFDPKSDRIKWADIDVCVEMGSVCLPIQQVRLLKRGSLLLLSGTYAEHSILRLKTNLAEIDIQENAELDKWVVTEIHQLERNLADQPEFLSSGNQILKNNSMYIDDIPVKLSIQLSQAKVRFMDLMHLEVGALIALETPTDLKVDIICNDIPIAQGCLVELDGKLAVELQSIRQTP
jgi:flagellar motor switch/type III secretory pathway protein FliN